MRVDVYGVIPGTPIVCTLSNVVWSSMHSSTPINYTVVLCGRVDVALGG